MEFINEHNSPKSPAKNHNIDYIDYDLEQPVWTLDQLKEAAIQQRVLRPRSLAWAILLNAVPPPNADILNSIKSHRSFYNDLKEKLSMDPHGVVGDDPLSQDDESVWRQHFCDNELKALILQDVVRTFPDELYFREKEVQDLMVRVLFYWSRSHSHVGYRQGMHEILAPVLSELFQDRQFAPKLISETLRYILIEEYLEHDSYMLFSAIMRGLERYYTTGDVIPNSCGRLPSSRVSHNPNEVVRYLDRVREEYLVPLDPELASHLSNSNISMELFGIRWLRLLFGREFPRSEIPHLWGFLFADGPTLPNLHYVILAMLLTVRNLLMVCDCGGMLSVLMRPSGASCAHVVARALHLMHPLQHTRPHTPPHELVPHELESASPSPTRYESASLEQTGTESSEGACEGVAEGADVARELAALGVLRARLPAAAAALAAALPRPPPQAMQPLQQILQLAALLQCRNHALIDVETALEAAEGDSANKVGRRQLLPIVNNKFNTSRKNSIQKPLNKVKEVPLKLFNQAECVASDLPCLDPLRLRTE